MTRLTDEQKVIRERIDTWGGTMRVKGDAARARYYGIVAAVPAMRRFVDLVKKHHANVAPNSDPLKMRELAVAAGRAAWRRGDPEGQDVIDQHCAALGIASNFDPPVWYMRPSACGVVRETDLHSIPSEVPKLLRSPGLLEARRPETGEKLFELASDGGRAVASLGWYHDGGSIILVGTMYPTGHGVAVWRPEWTGGDITPQLPALDIFSRSIGDPEAHIEFSRLAAQFVLVFALLAEVDPSPLRIELDRKERKVRHVYPSETTRPAKPTIEPEPHGERVAIDAMVTGHLKRQRHGPGRTLTKWIYVADYSARRYHAARYNVEKR